MTYKNRAVYKKRIHKALDRNPIVGILGPRQVGKTTLAREVASDLQAIGTTINYFDLENPQDLLRLEQPMLALEELEGLVVIDEIQRRSELYPILRVLADRQHIQTKFLVLGSASGDLLKQTSESLAGRIEYIELQGFGLEEIHENELTKLWIRGGFPKSFLASSEENSYAWRENLVRTFIEQDIPAVWERVPMLEMWRVWQMAAHYHGQTINYSEIGRSLGLNHKTIKKYIDILAEMFMVRQLSPWFPNVGSNIVKSPKFYMRDSGLLHALLGLKNREEVERHPRLGSLWEGFALEQVLRVKGYPWQSFFWAEHGKAEMDLVLKENGQNIGYEFKYADAPNVTKSMMIAKEALGLGKINIIIPRGKQFFIKEGIEVIPLGSIISN